MFSVTQLELRQSSRVKPKYQVSSIHNNSTSEVLCWVLWRGRSPSPSSRSRSRSHSADRRRAERSRSRTADALLRTQRSGKRAARTRRNSRTRTASSRTHITSLFCSLCILVREFIHRTYTFIKKSQVAIHLHTYTYITFPPSLLSKSILIRFSPFCSKIDFRTQC